MAGEVVVTHNKVVSLPDDPVAEARGEATPSDWNENHSLEGMDELLAQLRNATIVNMGGGDYTLTLDEALSAAIVLLNVGSGATLTYPTTYNDYGYQRVLLNNEVGGNDVIVAMATGGSTTSVPSGYSNELATSAGGMINVSDSVDGQWAREGADYVIRLDSGGTQASPRERELEYENNAFYGISSSGANRGYIPCQHAVNLDATRTLTDDASTQNLFPSGYDALSLQPGTYRFRVKFMMTAGTTSHFINFGLAGTATVSDTYYTYNSRNATANNNAASGHIWGWSNSATLGKRSTAGTLGGWAFEAEGTIRVTAAGTVIPQLSFNTATGATPTLQPGTLAEFTAIGDENITSVGDWA